jgi:hypothetical protein
VIGQAIGAYQAEALCIYLTALLAKIRRRNCDLLLVKWAD